VKERQAKVRRPRSKARSSPRARKIPVLETPRLLLHPVELADAAQIQQLFPQWGIVRYLRNSVPWPYPSDGALQYLRNSALPATRRGEAWHWTLRLKSEPQQVIGFISLMKSENENRGFWMGLPWQGCGLMSEACDAVNDYWFDVLKFPVLRVPKSDRKRGFALHFGKTRNARNRHGRARLCFRPPSQRSVGNYRRRVAQTKAHSFLAGRPASDCRRCRAMR
jgi:[ribosomal protein S5]-alanine N-acetyltransferase